MRENVFCSCLRRSVSPSSETDDLRSSCSPERVVTRCRWKREQRLTSRLWLISIRCIPHLFSMLVQRDSTLAHVGRVADTSLHEPDVRLRGRRPAAVETEFEI